MNEAVHVFKLLSDPSRLRILMLLTRRALSVCQLMGVLGISQPLVSRNLSLLREGADLSILSRRGSTSFDLMNPAALNPSTTQISLGGQRQITNNMAVSADAVYSLGLVKKYDSTRAGAVGLFTCFLCAYIVLTIIGVHFRGPNWDFFWSPDQWPGH